MGIVDLSVNMRATSALRNSPPPPPQIRIAPALAPNVGKWEWAVVEERLAPDGKTIMSRGLLANDLADDPMSAALAASSCLGAILAERMKGGE